MKPFQHFLFVVALSSRECCPQSQGLRLLPVNLNYHVSFALAFQSLERNLVFKIDKVSSKIQMQAFVIVWSPFQIHWVAKQRKLRKHCVVD